MKNIAILGSTGSIGESTLSVVRSLPGKFRVIALSANSDFKALYKQIQEFRPLFVCLHDACAAKELSSRVKGMTKVYVGSDGLQELVRDKRIEQVMFAISGSAALKPLICAIDSGKDIALANKEALVMAGSLIMNLARKNKVRIMPVDSEQSAIWQALGCEDKANLKKIYLTASGGPLRRKSPGLLKRVSLKEVLDHPRWKMGKKITVDSATLMNKGLEFLEAMFLFGVSADKIKVLVHPEALIHSMVEFIDGVIIAQISVTDMRIPIQYALSYPQRFANSSESVDFCKQAALHFEKPDLEKFPCLGLAYEAARQLGTLPCVMNAANEVAVEVFLGKRLSFIDIPKVVAKTMRNHQNKKNFILEDVLNADAWARSYARSLVERLS
jgi:1-deoxy-D-xylulose-5-phosphate reductoisomerase